MHAKSSHVSHCIYPIATTITTILYIIIYVNYIFLIFINNLDEDIDSNILKLADDTKIFREIRNSIDCSLLQAGLDKLVLWAQKWQMECNVDKCKIMHVGNVDDSSTYCMERSELTDV